MIHRCGLQTRLAPEARAATTSHAGHTLCKKTAPQNTNTDYAQEQVRPSSKERARRAHASDKRFISLLDKSRGAAPDICQGLTWGSPVRPRAAGFEGSPGAALQG
eukprot:1136797-Pelagomonas_calceolata.AAC.5